MARTRPREHSPWIGARRLRGLLQCVRQPDPNAELVESSDQVEVLLALGDRVGTRVLSRARNGPCVVLGVPHRGAPEGLDLALGKVWQLSPFHSGEASDERGHRTRPVCNKSA